MIWRRVQNAVQRKLKHQDVIFSPLLQVKEALKCFLFFLNQLPPLWILLVLRVSVIFVKVSCRREKKRVLYRNLILSSKGRQIIFEAVATIKTPPPD